MPPDKSLFAAPTKAELQKYSSNVDNDNEDLFAPPTKEELASASTPKEIGLMDKEIPIIGGTGRGYLQGGLDALPMAGAAAGGIAGLAGGPVTAVGGAAAGGVGGEALKSLGEKYLLNKEQSRPEYYGNLAKGGVEGASQEMGGQALSGLLGKIIGEGVGRSAKSAKVEEAADRLGLKPTRGMVSNSYVERNLENSLSQQPSIPGAFVRREQEPVKQGLDKGVRGLLEQGTDQSPFEFGRDVKGQLIQDLDTRRAPISQVYDDVKRSTPFIDVADKSKARIGKNILDNADKTTLPNTPERSLADTFVRQIEGSKNVEQLKQIQSIAKGIAEDNNSTYGQKQVASSVLEKIDRLQNNSIMRSAIQSARSEGEGAGVGKQLISDIKDANKQYREMMKDTNVLGEGSGLFKPERGKGVGSITNEINNRPNEEVGKAIFDTNNNEYLNFLKDKHPEVYEQAKNQYVGQIANKSKGQTGEVEVKKFLTNIKNMGPEAREHLFGEGANQKIEDIQTVIHSIPTKVGASDTPRGISFKDTLNPLQNVKDAGNYLLLKAFPMLRGDSLPEGAGQILSRAGGKGLLNVSQGAVGLLGQ